ncbi:MAG TPA: YceI family protein [Sphingomonadaceae bacterium]|nr:YceI family protein [Sphingomonadaceae bacterium]
MRLLLIPALFIALAPSLGAQPMPIPGTADVARVQAGTYKVDPAHTQVNWTVNHLGFSLFSGLFADATGTLVIDPRRPNASRLSITIPMNRVVSTSGALDTHLRNADFFDVGKHPTATFTSTRVQATGTRARITGNLTLRGVTRPVVLDARFIGAGNNPMGNKALNIGFAATTRISRSAFGITYGVPAVGDAVDLQINAAFEKE